MFQKNWGQRGVSIGEVRKASFPTDRTANVELRGIENHSSSTQFRPSGSLLRIDADAIREATRSDESFSRLPLPELKRNYQADAASVRPGQKPYAAIFGMISGEESDEQFIAAVESLS